MERAAPVQIEATLVENRTLAPHTFVLRLAGCAALDHTLPGQFVMLRALRPATDPLLSRAYSLLSVLSDGEVEILVRGTGKAATLFGAAQPGDAFQLLGPLGCSFPAPSAARTDWLVAGGVGLAPLLMHAVRARALGVADRVTMFYGGRGEIDLVLSERVTETGATLVCATEDGSRGHAGYVTVALEQALDALAADAPIPTLMACGPEPMLEAVARVAHRRGAPTYLSVEGEMACGIGACLACAVPCRTKPYRYACVEGPVFELSELAGQYGPEAS